MTAYGTELVPALFTSCEAALTKLPAMLQCRRRWINVLSAEMKTTDWSPQEDALLVEGHRLHGNKWSMLAGIIGGR